MKMEIEIPQYLAAAIRAGQAFYEVNDELFESVARKMVIEGFESHIVRGHRFDFSDLIVFDSRTEAQRIARKIVEADETPNRWLAGWYNHVKLSYSEEGIIKEVSVPVLLGSSEMKALLGEPSYSEIHP